MGEMYSMTEAPNSGEENATTEESGTEEEDSGTEDAATQDTRTEAADTAKQDLGRDTMDSRAEDTTRQNSRMEVAGSKAEDATSEDSTPEAVELRTENVKTQDSGEDQSAVADQEVKPTSVHDASVHEAVREAPAAETMVVAAAKENAEENGSEVQAESAKNPETGRVSKPDPNTMKPESPGAGPALLSSIRLSRTTETQTEHVQNAVQSSDAVDGGDQLFPVRRAISDWALVDRSASTANIRSERVRRTAQLFEDLALAQEQRQVALVTRRGGRRDASAPAATAVPPPEREIVLVPMPAPPPQQSRQVSAILALGSSGSAVDSDAEGDERDEEVLWEKVRAKIAARRSKFHRLESHQDEPEPRRPTTPRSPGRLSADRTSWLTNGTPAPPPSKQHVTTLKQQQKTAAASSQRSAESSNEQTAAPSKRQVKTLADQKVTAVNQQNITALAEQKVIKPVQPTQNGHAPETTRSSFGKYIEQRAEQEVLRSLGSSVLARQKLAAKEKARQQLLNEKAEAERRQKKAENQRTDARGRLEKTRGRLTRDSAFERKGLEALLVRLEGTIREETRRIDKLDGQIADADAGIEELRRRAAA